MRRLLPALCILAACGDGSDDRAPPPPVTYGSAVITWAMQDETGNPLTCEQLGLTHTSVDLGNERVDVPCGEPQRASFTLLEPGRYGITVRLEIAGRGSILTQTDNLDVVANQEATLDVAVEVNLGNLENGSMLFRWTIAGYPAVQNCAVFGVETIRIFTTGGSIGQFTRDVPCTDGQLVVDALAPGMYGVRAEMQDAEGVQISDPQVFTIRVEETEQISLTIAFFQNTGDPARFRGIWTITSSAAPATCEDVAASRVRVSIEPVGGQGVEIATASAACDQGDLLIENLIGGPNQVRARFRLISDLLGQLDVVTSTAFYLVAGRTATVSAGFAVE
jgi:hypothetical protein